MREMIFIKLALSCLVEGNRIHPEFPISTLPLHPILRQSPSCAKLTSPCAGGWARNRGAIAYPLLALTCLRVGA